jgi:hypothetical protein
VGGVVVWLAGHAHLSCLNLRQWIAIGVDIHSFIQQCQQLPWVQLPFRQFLQPGWGRGDTVLCWPTSPWPPLLLLLQLHMLLTEPCGMARCSCRAAPPRCCCGTLACSTPLVAAEMLLAPQLCLHG